MAGLYIHIPYCHSKCAYCDFYSRPDDGRADMVIDTITAELKCRRHEIAGSFDTVYIGGGTPSCLSAGQLTRLIEGVRPDNQLLEFTIEANPEDVNTQTVALWSALGIDRVSMGVQSLNDGELAAIGRRHTADDALRALDCIVMGGIDRISCDLIYGLPGQTLASWQASLDRLLSTGITHLSAYSLSYEPGTLLYARMQSGRLTPTDDDTVASMYSLLTDHARRAGMRHYEISNFAEPGFEAVHNSSYWHSVPYLGLGPSAHSFDGHTRRVNPASTVKYLAGMPSYAVEDESPVDSINDVLVTRLRTDNGLNLTDDIPARYRHAIETAAAPWLASGHLFIQDNCLIIKEEAWLVSDAIMRDLLICE